MHEPPAGTARKGLAMAAATLRQPPAPVMYKIPEVMAMLRMSRHLLG